MPIRQRDDDEITLDILDMHREGIETEKIAKVLKISQRKVRQRIAAVIEQDCAHDPTAAEYWQRPQKGNPDEY